MADNTTLNVGSGGDAIRTEDRTTFKTPVSLIDVGGVAGEALIGDAGNFMPVKGAAAENAAATGNPVLVGARYDASPRTLGDGDVGAIALDADGAVHVSDGGNTITVDGSVTVSDSVAHDAADSGNGAKIVAKADSGLSANTMVADNDRTDLFADVDGTLIVRLNHPFGDMLQERVSDTGGTSTAFTNFAAQGASIRSYVTSICIANTSATNGYVDFRDGTAGSVLWTVPIPANGGVVISNGGQPIFRTTANTALAYDVSAALTTVYISISGFKSKA